MDQAPNDIDQLSSHLDGLLAEAKAFRDSAGKGSKIKPVVQPAPGAQPEAMTHGQMVEVANPADEKLHSRIQNQLIQLGLAAGCSVWIAINHKNRLYHAQPLDSSRPYSLR